MTPTAAHPAVDRRILRALWGTTRHGGRGWAEVRRRAELDGDYAHTHLERAVRRGYAGKAYSGAFGGTTYWLTDEGRAHLDAPN